MCLDEIRVVITNNNRIQLIRQNTTGQVFKMMNIEIPYNPINKNEYTFTLLIYANPKTKSCLLSFI